MDFTDYLQLLGILLARHIPLLVVALIGLWFAIKRRESLARVAKRATWGFSLLIAYALVSVLLQFALFAIQISEIEGGARSEAVTRWTLWALGAHPLLIAGLAALARAIFMDRVAAASEPVAVESSVGAA